MIKAEWISSSVEVSGSSRNRILTFRRGRRMVWIEFTCWIRMTHERVGVYTNFGPRLGVIARCIYL